MPRETFPQTTGRTIRPETTTGTHPVTTHRMTSRLKEATGVARMTRMAGEKSQSAHFHAWVAAPRAVPASTPQRSPPKIRSSVRKVVCQNSAVPASSTSVRATVRGAGRIRSVRMPRTA